MSLQRPVCLDLLADDDRSFPLEDRYNPTTCLLRVVDDNINRLVRDVVITDSDVDRYLQYTRRELLSNDPFA